MPLVRFEVRNEYGLGDPELYRRATKREDPKALLDGVAVAGLVGILRQLGDLAEFAAEVFHDLHEQVMATSSRGHKLLARIHHIEEALPSLENAVQGQTSHIHFAYVAGSDWHANIRSENSHLLSSDLPRFMLDSYEECRDPPRLYLLDKFDSGGTGACLRRYSDPSYFKRVWTASELEKAEKVPREKKPLKSKKKRSLLRNGEVQPSVSMSRHHNSIHFASPNSDSRSFSIEDISISDMRLKSEHVSESPSSGSRTRMSVTEECLCTNPSVAPDEVEYDKLSVTKSQINHSDSCSSVIVDDTNHDVADGVSHHGSLPGSVPRSPSVTWDEKTEIVKPSSPKSCDDILVDRILDSEPLPETSEPSCMDHETAVLGEQEQQDFLLDIPNAPVSLSSGNHFDEVTSEAENYMDALNTLESETETDSEYQTKREVRSFSNFSYQGTESETRNLQEMAAVNSDSSDAETPVASRSSFSKDVPPEATNLDSPESPEQAQSPLSTGFASVSSEHVQSSLTEYPLDTSSVSELSKNVSDTSGTKVFGGFHSHPSPESSIPNLQTMSGDETTGSTSKSANSPFDNSGVSSTKLWTNAGLFGVEPSKPPDFSVPDIVTGNDVSGSKCTTGGDLLSYTEKPRLRYGASFAKSDSALAHNDNILRNSINLENMDGSPNTLSSIDRSSLNSDQLCSIIYNVVQPNDPSKCSPSFHESKHGGMSVSENSQSSSQLERFGNTISDSNHAYSDRHGQQIQHKLPDYSNIQFQPCESGQNANTISSGFSGLAQRFLANSLQKKESVAQTDVSPPPRVLNDDTRKLQEASLSNKQKEELTGVNFPLSYEHSTKAKNDGGSFRKSISSSSRYSETSSPPLEHMKISFHPMNGLETSKLKLEFPSGNLHESNEDLMFPSFQLLPGPVLPSQDCGLESDDDTFCRSCPYSSEDIASPRSYSNSEFWDQDERSVGKDHEIYDDSRILSSSSTSNSSFMGFEQINPCNINSASEFENYEAKDGSASCQSGPVVDIPGLYSVISLKNQQEMQCDSLLDDHANSTLRSPNELPPPPPLPPVQWRVLRSSFSSKEDKDSNNGETFEHFNYLQPKGLTVPLEEKETSANLLGINETEEARSETKMNLVFQQDQQEMNGKKDPNNDLSGKGTDAREELLHQIRNKHDLKKINGHTEMKKNGDKEPDEREELLHQIKNKTFNLRRTIAAKPSFMPQPATNVNVAAILEKANAIRQAFVGSDDGGDDDNWSDG